MPLDHMVKYLVVFSAGTVASLLLTRCWLRLAPRLGLMDRPGGRKLHDRPVPVGGGIAVFLGFHIACAVLFLFPWNAFSSQIGADWWFRFLPLSTGVVLLGLVDDRVGMKPLVKLSGQILFAMAAYFLNIRVQNVLGLNLPEWMDFISTVLWFLALMNAFNLIDGIDGLAAGIALIAAVGIGVSLVFRQLPGDVLLFAGFAGACLGFLRYNYYPAAVFLGDTGSLFIGFTLAALTISASSKGPAVAAIGMPLLAVGVPLFDTVLAVWRRSVRRILAEGVEGQVVGIDRADADHLHHRLLRQGRNHHQVARLLYGATALLALAGICATVFNDRALGILALGFVIAVYVIFKHLAWIELRDSGEAVLKGIARPVRRNRTLLFYLVADLLILNLAWVAATVLVQLQAGTPIVDLKSAWLLAAPVDVAFPFIALLVGRSYSRLWSLARISEYIAAGMAVATGYAVACAVSLIIAPVSVNSWGILLHYVLCAGIAVPAIVGIRAALRVAQDLVHRPGHASHERDDGRPQALVWGIGLRTVLYLRQQTLDGDVHKRTLIAGIVSNDSAATGHTVHGVRVLGDLQAIPVLVRERNIQLIYLVEEICPEELSEMRHLLRGSGVRLIRWKIDEQEILSLAEGAPI